MTRDLKYKELDVIGHSLGINVYHAKLSKKKKDKKLPKEFYRNYFCTNENSSDFSLLTSLVKVELMYSWKQYDNIYFGVSEEGVELFRDEFKKFMDSQELIFIK